MEKFKKILKGFLEYKIVSYPIISLIVVVILTLIFVYIGIIPFLICASVLAIWILYRTVMAWINWWNEEKGTLHPRDYWIRNGWHYTGKLPRFRIIKKNHKFNAVITMATPCKYHFGNYNDYDVNKLWGITFGVNPLKNSIRFGWNCEDNDGKIVLFVFQHHNKIMSFERLQKINVEEKHKYSIEIVNKNNAILCIDDIKVGEYEVNFSHFITINNPYFGGNQKAPHDMIIIEDDLKRKK